MNSRTMISQVAEQRAHPTFIGVPTEELLLDISWIRQTRLDVLDDTSLADSTRQNSLEYLEARAAPIIREIQRRHEQHQRYKNDPLVGAWPTPEQYQKLLDLAARLKTAVPLHEFVRLAVPGADVQPSGRNWKVSCPLHTDKTPSMTLFEDQHFHCFSCREHGDVFTMIGLIDNIERFPDQVRALASWYGLAVKR